MINSPHVHRCPTLALTAIVAMFAMAGHASAKQSPHFQRGHLPSIGEIELVKKKGGRIEITVPVSYTQALAGHPAAGLESAEVTLDIARQIRHGRAVGTLVSRRNRHGLAGSKTVVDHFPLGRRASRWLLGRPRKERGRLVRVDVRHRTKERRGARPLHEKDASMTMASSHQAHPAGESAVLTVRNDTAEPIKTAAEPILCMYSNGEFGSNLQAFTTPEGRPIQPAGTIEAVVEGSASILDEAEYQGGTSEGAGHWFDWQGVATDLIANALEIEITPILLGLDLAEHCDAQASTFMLVAGSQSGEAASSEAWVLTSETCRIGCVHTHLPTAAEALDVQGVGEEQTNPGEWAEDSTKVLKALVGGWREPPVGGEAVQDRGLHWSRQELPEVFEEWVEPDGEGFETVEIDRRAWELSIHEGSSSAGYSG